MGCNSSKVFKTHVEIIRIKHEVKSSVKWWKKRKKENREQPKSGFGSDVLPGCPSNSPQSPSFDGSEDVHPPKDSVEHLNATKPNHQEYSPQYPSNKSAELIESCDKFQLTAVGGSDKGKNPTGLGALPPLNGRKSRMANDLTVEEFEDSSDLSDDMEQLARSQTRVETPTVSHHVPLIAHNAWSDFSVGHSRNGFVAPKTKVKKFHSYELGKLEGKSLTDRRNRPMAAKGERKQPELTAVYNAELSIPGTPVPNPKRQQEESCLNAWMSRRLGDEC